MALRLLEADIENFRGFAKRQVVPLDGDVVLISGGNGTGKTSLTDAITWNLTGELPGLAQRLKGERKGEDYVLSCYGSGPARVRLKLLVQEQTWVVERRGSAGGSELHVTPSEVPPSVADAHLARLFGFDDYATLTTGVHAWGVLRQDSMRATLEQGSEALHRRLREILGLSVLVEFEAATREAAQGVGHQAEKARHDLDELGQQLGTAKAELETAHHREATREVARAAASARLERLLTEPIAGVRLRLSGDAASGAVMDVGTQVAGLLREALDITQQMAGVPSVVDVPSAEAIAELRVRGEAAERALAELEAQHSVELRMAEAALRLLSDHCPVCAQSINEQEVRENLQRRIADDAGDAAGLARARERVATARTAVEEAESAFRRAQAGRSARERAGSRWARVVADATLVEVPSSWREPESLENAQSGLQSVRAELQAAYRELIEIEHDPAVARLTARVAELQARELRAREKAEDAARRGQQADALRRAATEAAVEITQQSLDALEPAFAEVYDRLAPHPSFTQLKMFHEVFYGKGRSSPRILDPVRGIEANPNLVCSEGQLNVVALSYFLALNLETERGGLPFAILDDPLQAMDVINVLGFCDVARALREHRQLIITTHDRRFGALLERKLSPRQSGQRTLHLQFSAWDPSGPRVDVVEPAFEEVPSLLHVG